VAVVALSTLPLLGSQAAAAPLADAPRPAAAASTATPAVDVGSLQAQRTAVLARRDTAIEVHNAALLAAEQERIAELGYDPKTATEPREIARQMMLNKYEWGEDEFTCYDAIIMRESKWDPYADNPHSTAYGIPQALPGNRMAAFGDDWRTNPATQITWGLDYVEQRYGTPCQAWSFKRGHGWY